MICSVLVLGQSVVMIIVVGLHAESSCSDKYISSLDHL